MGSVLQLIVLKFITSMAFVIQNHTESLWKDKEINFRSLNIGAPRKNEISIVKNAKKENLRKRTMSMEQKELKSHIE